MRNERDDDALRGIFPLAPTSRADADDRPTGRLRVPPRPRPSGRDVCIIETMLRMYNGDAKFVCWHDRTGFGPAVRNQRVKT